MNIDAPTGPPPAYTRGDATFAQVVGDLHKSVELSPDFKDALDAFREFLVNQEKITLSKDQLRILKSQSVYVLEECAKYRNEGGDLSRVLPIITQIFTVVSEQLAQGPRWDQVVQDPSAIDTLNATIGDAFDRLAEQMRQMAKGENAESTMYKKELESARENDHKKIAELEAAIRDLESANRNPNDVVQSSMTENLKIIGDSSVYVGQKQIDARRSLAVISELTGKSLPPSTMLDRNFVSIGSQAISQGASYDVFLGEYFTGEKVAIKVLRHRVDEVTAQRTHERFARQTENWAALRHDCILPFYGVGVMQSPISPQEYQLYLVSPYLQNQDVKRYLKTYPAVSGSARLQMALDIVRGLKYMHGGGGLPGPDGNGLVHSALNIYNVLVKDSGRAVISGFGHAKVVSLKDFQASFTGDNSEYRYMGPEILDDAVLTFGSDIWSWAMTSLEILTDEPPFGAKTRGTKIIQMIGTEKRPERSNHPKIEEYDHSDEIWQLFEDCWKKQPGDRPSARDVVQRLKPLVQQLGKKSDPNVQKPPTPTYPRTEYGRVDPSVQQPIPPPERHELGKSTKPVAQGTPPQPGSRSPEGEGEGNQEGRATQPVVPGSTPPPSPPAPVQ
ncbi:kinase-like domain-containing protein [Rhizoctonia solani]|nr:kinase-like domain-containing protein [Rhizoctonia solani]